MDFPNNLFAIGPTIFELWVMETELWVMKIDEPNTPLISLSEMFWLDTRAKKKKVLSK